MPGGLVRHPTRVEAHPVAWKLHDLGTSGSEQDGIDGRVGEDAPR